MMYIHYLFFYYQSLFIHDVVFRVSFWKELDGTERRDC